MRFGPQRRILSAVFIFVAMFFIAFLNQSQAAGKKPQGGANPDPYSGQCEVKTTDGHNACVEGHTHHYKYPLDDSRMYTKNETMGQFRKRDPNGYYKFMDKWDAQMRSFNALLGKAQALTTDYQRHKHAARRNFSTPRYSSGRATCANNYGGPAANSGQYICSNQGELLACRCGGGRCSLIHTGAIQCTRPGAIVN